MINTVVAADPHREKNLLELLQWEKKSNWGKIMKIETKLTILLWNNPLVS